ncbi:MAG: PTS sugar transporter subunit IIC [Erysipelotrichia bacterium]|nr:PTS sugar transporter subunit IIC [Erysipelotrichia bacterium]
MTALQAALIAIVSALSCSTIEGGWFGECKLREPVVTGALVGLILGDLKQGLIIGAQLELIWMGVASIGPVAGLAVGPGGTIGTAIALSTGAGIEAAMTFGVPVSVLLQFIQSLIDTSYSAPMHTVDKLIDEGGQEKKIVMIHWLCGILTFAFYWLLTFVALYFGNDAINMIVNNLPAWVNSGLGAVAKVLPALGFALLLSLLLESDLIPYFIIGFALAAYLGVSMVGVAGISVALAWIVYILKRDSMNSAAAPAKLTSTTDEEDEL